MAKRPSLANLKNLNARLTPEAKPAPPPDALTTPSKQSPSRLDKVHVGGYFSADVRKQLKMLALEQDKSTQRLVGEALNLLFSNYGKPEIAESEKE